MLAYAAGALTIALLIGFQAREAQAGLIMVGGVAGLLLLAALAAWLLLALLKKLPQRGVTWRFGLANLRRRAFASSLQIGALALGLMALLLLTVVRGDLMRSWRASLPPDAPNQFLVNVLPDQVADARAQLRSAVGADVVFSPMVRGRLVAVNGADLDTKKYTETRARRLAEREFNLSWTDSLPKGNRVAGGTFWTPGASGVDAGMSLEDGIAGTLGVKLGDVLTFDIAGARVSAPVTSLRKVDWDSFRVNFFALFPPGPLADMPTTYIAAFRAPEGNGAWLTALVQKHPNILAIDIGEIVRQVQGIMESVSRAVEFVFLFTLAGGLLVLQAAIAATQDERRFDAAILRTLGASQRQLAAAQIAEFLLLGALAGIVAAAGATAIGWALADRVFKIPFEPSLMDCALRHRRRRGRGDARRMAGNALDRPPAAAGGHSPAGLTMVPVRDADDCGAGGRDALRAAGRRRRRARAGRCLLRPHGPGGGLRRHPQPARGEPRRRARQALLVPVRLAGRTAAVRRALRPSAPARAAPAVSDRHRRARPVARLHAHGARRRATRPRRWRRRLWKRSSAPQTGCATGKADRRNSRRTVNSRVSGSIRGRRARNSVLSVYHPHHELAGS